MIVYEKKNLKILKIKHEWVTPTIEYTYILNISQLRNILLD